MNINEVTQLLAQFDQSTLTEFELKEGSFELYMSKNTGDQRSVQIKELPTTLEGASASRSFDTPFPGMVTPPTPESVQHAAGADEATGKAPSPAAVEDVSNGSEAEEITSPLVGIVYLQPAPEKPSFKAVGDPVKKGEVVCIIEAMKLMNEIVSTVDGTVTEILIGNEDVVEFGQPLFKVAKEGQ